MLATEIYRSIHVLFSTTMQEKLKLIEDRYELRRNTILEYRPLRTKKYGIESVAYLPPTNLVVSTQGHQIFLVATLNTFKTK